MASSKRVSVPPPRLRYHGLGEQHEVQETAAIRAPPKVVPERKKPNFLELKDNTDDQLEEIVKDCEYRITSYQDCIDRLASLVEQNLTEDSMSQDEWSHYVINRSNYNTAIRFLPTTQQTLSAALRILKERESKRITTESTPTATEKKAKSKTMSLYSSAASRLMELELNSKEKELKIRHNLTDQIADVNDQLNLLQVQLGNPELQEAQKAKLSYEIQLLLTTEDQLNKKLQREVKKLQESKNLQKQIIESEEEMQQRIALSDEDEVKDNTEEWVNRQSTMFHEPDSQQKWHEPYVSFRRDEEKQDPLFYRYHQQPIHNNPIHGHGYQSHYRDAHQHGKQPKQSQTEKHGEGDGVAALTSALRNVVFELRGTKEWDPKGLPTFNGSAVDWPIFKGEFDRTTPRDMVNSSQNAIRLRKALTGQALEAVVGLLHEPSNVQRIMNILEQNFGRRDLILQALANKAETVKAPDINKPETFIIYGRAVQQLVETARSMRDNRYLNDIGLQTKLVCKLPPLLAENWIKWISIQPHRVENLASFCEWVEIEMNIKMKIAKPVGADFKDGKSRGNRGSAHVNVVDTNTEPTITEKKCCFCDKSNHKLQRCFTFKKEPVESKLKVIRENNLCFRCLEHGHSKKDCTSTIVCNVNGCCKEHHPLIHGSLPAKPKKQASQISKQEQKIESKEEKVMKPEVEVASSAVNISTSASSNPLSICQVRVRGPAGVRKCFALLDSGASRTIIDEGFAKELGISGKSINHTISGIKNIKVTEKAEVVDFEISGVYQKARYYSITDAVTTSLIGVPAHSQDAAMVISQFPHLKRAKLDSFKNAVVKVVIGEDHPKPTAHRYLCEGNDDEPMAKRTLLGWVLAGKINSRINATSKINFMLDSPQQSLDQLVKQTFSMESFGIIPTIDKGSAEDKKALAILQRTVKKKNNYWESGLLWREENINFPESRSVAYQALLSNEKRMNKNPEFKQMYCDKINEYLKKDYIRELTPAEVKRTNGKTMYIPHFGVFNINKPGKLRLVFNAATKVQGVSLNDALLTGPDLIRPLPAVLWNFRIHNYVIQGDMEDMFHRVYVKPEDQDSQRFLWRDPDNKLETAKTYVMKVLIFGACSSPATAIYVKNINASIHKNQFPEASRAIVEDFYCDDGLTGGETEDAVIELRQQIYDINLAGNFKTRKWLSNSKIVLASIPPEDRAVGVKEFDSKSEIPTERVLGMWWNAERDCFTFKVNFKKVKPEIIAGERPTKRQMCSLLMTIFDPLGLIANYKIKGMILFQKVWRSGIDWDDLITDIVFEDWKHWISYLKEVEKLEIPRLYCRDIHLATSVELHTMSDASEEGISVICFLRIQTGETVTVSFVSAKCKVSPLKKYTIPRLELTGAVLGAGLADKIVAELKVGIHRRVYWTDSRTVLMWLRSETLRYKEFVANRVGKILELTDVAEWKWVPTKLNIADEGTRLSTPVRLESSSPWFHGPEFLHQSEDNWPLEDKSSKPTEIENEVKTKMCITSVYGNVIGNGEAVGLIHFDRFSSFTRLIRVMTCVRKAARYWLFRTFKNRKLPVEVAPWKLKSSDKLPQNVPQGLSLVRITKFLRKNLQPTYSADELKVGEYEVMQNVQREVFQTEMRNLGTGGAVTKSSKIWRLLPWMDNGIIRMKGRIGAAKVSQETNCPVIIPSNHVVTHLLIDREHKQNGHQGIATILVKIREKYWVVGGKATVRRVVGKCFQCRMANVKPIIQKMGDLPFYRLTSGNPPFTYTGVDYFGPMEVTVGRHHEKRWIALFTCMVTRAIQLELAYGLSTDDFLLAFSRFVDTRGRPRIMFSDNGTNFVGAKKELKDNYNAMNWEAVSENEKFQEIKWQFSPPGSPHFGGIWERKVQIVKKVLRTTLKEKFPQDKTLMTLIKGAENIVNSTPLTYVSEDPRDPEVLTPNHFLRGFCDVGPSLPGEFTIDDESRRAHWRRAQLLLEQFWERWTREVLPDLGKTSKWHTEDHTINVGDVVLLVDEHVPRNTWKRGIITTIFPGKDGLVRVVEVITSDSSGKKTIYKRGVDKICPLGLSVGKSGQLP